MSHEPTYLAIAQAIRQRWIESRLVLPGERLPTERTLETELGVSRSTISRALSVLNAEGWIVTKRGSGAYVTERARASVAVPDLRMIGFIAPHFPEKLGCDNPVLTRIFRGVERRASELGFQAITASSHYSVEHEQQLIRQFLQLGVAGIVLYPTYFPAPRRRANARRDPLAQQWKTVPIVLTDIGFEEWGRSMVLVDNTRLAYEMTIALLARGRRRIVFMHSDAGRLHTSLSDRRNGWELALRRHGVPIPESYLGWPDGPDYGLSETISEGEALQIADRLLALDPKPDAVIAWDDPAAIWLIRALQARRVTVPDDILVVGFDNYEAGQYFDPAFPTTAPDFVRLGEVAVEILDQQLRTGHLTPRTHLLSAPVLWREPTEALKKEVTSVLP